MLFASLCVWHDNRLSFSNHHIRLRWVGNDYKVATCLCVQRCPLLLNTLHSALPNSVPCSIMLFMAVTSTGSAELIAVSSLFSYDVYR